MSLREPPTWLGRRCSRPRRAKWAPPRFSPRPTSRCRFPRSSPRRRLLFRTVVTPREFNADARIKIRATVGCVNRIDVERGPRPSDPGQNSAHSGAWTRVNAPVLEIQGRGPGPATGTPREGERSSDRESLKTLPPNCCAMIHAEAGLRASRGSIILCGFSRLSRWAEIARQWRHIDVSSVCHEPRV